MSELDDNEYKELKTRIDKFMARPDFPEATRRNLSKAYHPDLHPEDKEFFTETMKVINGFCDKLLGNKKGK